MAAYFTDSKKGEVNELRNLLRNPEIQRDPARYRYVVQKVIAFMTQGIDVAPLFTDMIMASASNDIIQKKLCYLYIGTYAESHSELALLIVNTLQKDARHQNPIVRALALRSMCSLRLPSISEYIREPLSNGLKDKSGYVRKTAVLGCVKLYYVDQQLITDLNIVDRLYRMLRDTDPQVICNCVIALDEMLANEGGIVVNKSIAHHLLNMLKDFNEWSQSLILRVLSRYKPADEDEMFDILTMLDERLKHANSGVVLSTIQLFLQLTQNMPEVQEDVYERIRAPLVTLVRSGTAELAYACLHHMQLLITRRPRLLEADYRTFFCRYNDPLYVKCKRLDLLIDISAESNACPIIDEISAYVSDVGVDMARRSIRALGKIAMRLESASQHAMGKLLSFFTMEFDYVTSETLIVMQDLMRKYTWMAEAILPQLPSCLEIVQDSEGRAALVWMLGEHGEHLEDAPYLLEHIIDNIATEESSTVRLELLTATMKLFFKRPPECQLMLGRLLEYAVDEESNMDVHDRGMLYYRLLKANAAEAKRVVCSPKEVIEQFAEDQVEEKTDLLFQHFNSLSAIYKQLPELFISRMPPYTLDEVAQGNARGPDLAELPPADPHSEVVPALAPIAAAAGTSGTLLDFDLAPAASPGGAGHAIAAAGPSTQLTGDLMGLLQGPTAAIDLDPDFRMMPQDFQQHWVNLPEGESQRYDLVVVPTPSEMEQTMMSCQIVTMASSPPQEVTKFFFYAKQSTTNTMFFIEATIDSRSSVLTAGFKCTDASSLAQFREHFRKSLVGKWMPLEI
ncbi:AP-4 complex subunit beta-1-like [Sycon ciliatum]|uniref:AP-4 complex subunit beta-1-like n=1 Tax=Sycon ciliatum TaxID=27933 RepID=UPI0031F69463